MYGEPIEADALWRLAQSGAWVKKLDRVRLGRFAIDADVLVVLDALERLSIEQPSNSSFSVSYLNRELDIALGREESILNQFHTSGALRAEIFFWWEREGYETEYIYDKRSHYRSVDVTMNLLAKVYENTDRLSFYEAEIWDEDFISGCLSEGIDVAMATSVVGT